MSIGIQLACERMKDIMHTGLGSPRVKGSTQEVGKKTLIRTAGTKQCVICHHIYFNIFNVYTHLDKLFICIK